MYLPTNGKSVIEIDLFILNILTNIIYYLKNNVIPTFFKCTVTLVFIN